MANLVTRVSRGGDPLRNPKNFLFKTWRYLGLPDPSPLQYDFIEYLNDHRAWAQVKEEADKELRAGNIEGARKILMAFRGAAKTYVCTTNGVYRLREDPLEECLVVSATDNYASAITTMAFNMVTKFDWLAPDMAPTSDQRQSALSFDVKGARAASKDASFTARGIFGQITGLRSTLIIGDDLETPNTSETELKRQNLRHRMSELGGAIIKPGGDILLLGTAQHEQTVYKEYAEEKGYELRIYPIVYPRRDPDPKKDEMVHYGTRLAPSLAKALEENPLLAGTSTEPTRFNARDILQRATEWGKTEFERQFKMWMDAGAGRLYPLKLKDIISFELTPPNPATGNKLLLPHSITWAALRDNRHRDIQVDALPGDSAVYAPIGLDVMLPATEIICQVDPSGEGSDETSWSILASAAGRVFLCHQGSRLEGHTEDTLKALAADCALWNVGTVKIESNFGQGMFGTLLRPYLTSLGSKAEIIDERSGQTQKERRIVEALEPLVTTHRLVINTAVLRADFDVTYSTVEEAKRRFYRLTYQFTRITKQKGSLRHDDRVDSLAAGCTHFQDQLQKALTEEESRSKDEAIAMEAEKIVAARKAAGLPVVGWLPEAPGFARQTGHRKEDRTNDRQPR